MELQRVRLDLETKKQQKCHREIHNKYFYNKGIYLFCYLLIFGDIRQITHSPSEILFYSYPPIFPPNIQTENQDSLPDYKENVSFRLISHLINMFTCHNSILLWVL